MKPYTKTEFENAIEQSLGFKKEFPDEQEPEFYWFVKQLEHSKFKNLNVNIDLRPNLIEVWCIDQAESNIGEVCIIKEELPSDHMLALLAVENLLQMFKI